MTVTVICKGKKQRVQATDSVRGLLNALGVNPETVLTARNGVIVPETAALKAGDMIELIQVISGG